jgi:hypothetical protein
MRLTFPEIYASVKCEKIRPEGKRMEKKPRVDGRITQSAFLMYVYGFDSHLASFHDWQVKFDVDQGVFDMIESLVERSNRDFMLEMARMIAEKYPLVFEHIDLDM